MIMGCRRRGPWGLKMIKSEELSNPKSCLNRALDSERVFVLLARDEAAPTAIRAWVGARLLLGKNVIDDPQIQEALRCADAMDAERDEVRAQIDGSTTARPLTDAEEIALREYMQTRMKEIDGQLWSDRKIVNLGPPIPSMNPPSSTGKLSYKSDDTIARLG